MLLNFDSAKPVYLLGKGIAAQAWKQNLKSENIDPIEKSIEDIHTIPNGSQCFLGVLDIKLRTKLLSEIDVENYIWPTYVHPTAFVEDPSSLGQGVWIYSFSYISCLATVGDFSVITSYSNVGHNSEIGKNNVTAINTMIAGSVRTGQNVFFGIGSKIRDKIDIADNVVILMDSVVTKNIIESGTYYGNKKTKAN